MLRCLLLFATLVSTLGVCLATQASINVTTLDEQGLAQWEPEIFSGETTYTITSYQGRTALQALSDNAASGLVLKKRIDLLKTPYINWSWLAGNKLPLLDERKKTGDDYLARIYVVIDGGLLLWRTKSLSYVWSSHQEKQQAWDNAYASSQVKMLAVRGKQAETGQWYTEKRHVYQDLIHYFGDKGSDKANQKAYRFIDAIAIMTDTDNSGSQAEAYYGDIIFSEE